MQTLGIYKYYDGYYEHDFEFLRIFKQLQIAQLHLPVVVILEYDRYENLNNNISILPAFYSIDRHPIIHQVLAKSFGNDQGSYMLADAGRISWLSIYLVDSFDMPSIHVLTKDMTMTFPGIIYLTFSFENSCEIVSFLLSIIVFGLINIHVISAITGDERNYLFIPSPG